MTVTQPPPTPDAPSASAGAGISVGSDQGTSLLLSGSEAVARASIDAGCRFFAGYPMSPFTNLLESFSKLMRGPERVCVAAESEIEGANMAIGAAATGARAATGSCGQGLALMQEAIAESALNETPLVFFNMARSQQDYFQATRGGGWGDYRTIALAPKDVHEAIEHTHLLFHLADLYRVPTLFYGDHFIAHTEVGVTPHVPDLGPLPPKDWALDGRAGGSGRSKLHWTWNMGKVLDPGPGPDAHWRAVAAKFDEIRRLERRWEVDHPNADVMVVSFGTAAGFVEHVARELRAEGLSIGTFRPITLWPFPEEALAEATEDSRHVLVFEVNAGQMVDDVRLSVGDRSKIRSIGGISADESGLRYGALLDVPAVRARILAATGLEAAR
ncbi:transketolase C-terminal domain-containing protein [Frankia canadensis]|nr:transketolase C-terminal domain-containing protein [Frankia canadensis]